MVTERSLVFGSLLVGSGLQFLFSIFPFVMGGSSSAGFGGVPARPICQPQAAEDCRYLRKVMVP